MAEPTVNSEHLLRTLVQYATVGICMVQGEEMKVAIANQAYADLMNRPVHEVQGKNLFEVIPEAREHFYPLIDRVRHTGEPFHASDYPYCVTRNGHHINGFVDLVYLPYMDQQGRTTGVIMLCQDVTGQVMTRRALEQTVTRFRQLAMDAPFAMAIFSGTNLVIELANPAMHQMLGLPPDAFGKPLLELVPVLEGQLFTSKLHSVINRGENIVDKEMALELGAEGKNEVFIDAGIQALRGDTGSVRAVLLMAKDVTERIMSKKRVEESESNLRNIILQSPVAKSLLTGPDHIISMVNRRMLDIWGVQEDQVVNRPVQQSIPVARVKGFMELLEKVYATGETVELFAQPLFVPMPESMETRYINWVYQAYRRSDHTITGIMVVAMDVTEQVVARQRLEIAEERARLAIQSAELGIFEADVTNNTIEGDERFYEIYGFDKSASWSDVVATLHPEDLPLRTKALETALSTGVLDYEARYLVGNRSVRWVRGKGKVLYDTGHKATRIIGVVQDVTEQRQFAQSLERKVEERTKELEEANERLQQTNAELNQFAYVASHDLQEPLRKVKTFTGLLETSLGETSEKSRTFIRKIFDSTTRMQTLIYDILQFSKLAKENERFEPVDLEQVVRSVMSDYELLIEQQGAVILLDRLPVLEAIPLQMTQLFTNLLSNALKFKSDERALTIRLQSRELAPEELRQYPELAQNRAYRLITVQDNGIGFGQEYATRIFEIFQRLNNRSRYEGTGIGLALCKKILLKHNGTIFAEGKPGQGSVFTIILPEQQAESHT